MSAFADGAAHLVASVKDPRVKPAGDGMIETARVNSLSRIVK
jgi:hypothetical protein